MSQEEIFRLLLLVLLMSNEDSAETSTYGKMNDILIIGLLLGMKSDTDSAASNEFTTF